MQEPTPEQQEAWELSQIRQRRSRLNAKPIGRVVRNLMASSGYGEIESREQLLQHWRAAVGPELANHTAPARLARGVLHVQADNSSIMQELHFRRKQIVSALQRQLGAATITDLRIRVGE